MCLISFINNSKQMQYCIFLKQINFRYKQINMKELESLIKSIGFDNVKIILRTGNIILNSNIEENELLKYVSKKINNYYSFQFDTFIRTINSIKTILTNAPFKTEKYFYNQVFICNKEFTNILLENFSKIDLIENEKYKVVNNVMYWYYDKKTQENSKIMKFILKNSIKSNYTLRTIGTLEKILLASQNDL